VRPLFRPWCSCTKSPWWAVVHSGVIDEHVNPGLLAQLRAPVNLHYLTQQCRRHSCLLLLRPPRRWHSREGTCFCSPSRFVAPGLTMHFLFMIPTAKLAARVLDHSIYFQDRLRASLAASSIPPHILSLPAHLGKSTKQLPTPIVPLITPRARSLSAHLLARGLNARPISWPTVPKGMDRVRVCLHAGNTRAELDALADGVVGWAARIARAEQDEQRRIEDISGRSFSEGKLLQSKL